MLVGQTKRVKDEAVGSVPQPAMTSSLVTVSRSPPADEAEPPPTSVDAEVLPQVHLARSELGHRGVDDDTAAAQDDHLIRDVEDQLRVLLDEEDREPLRLEPTDGRHHLGDDLRGQALRGL